MNCQHPGCRCQETPVERNGRKFCSETCADVETSVPKDRHARAGMSTAPPSSPRFLGGFLGVGDKLFAIPWDALRLDTESHEFVLNVDKRVLKNAPGFDKDNSARLRGPLLGRGRLRLLRLQALLAVTHTTIPLLAQEIRGARPGSPSASADRWPAHTTFFP